MRMALHTGDKPRSFVGSKQWVGAIELGFVLDTLLGVTCRVITVPSGADLPSKARELAHHFDTQARWAAPLMIDLPSGLLTSPAPVCCNH
jgi:hypothetical protein